MIAWESSSSVIRSDPKPDHKARITEKELAFRRELDNQISDCGLKAAFQSLIFDRVIARGDLETAAEIARKCKLYCALDFAINTLRMHGTPEVRLLPLLAVKKELDADAKEIVRIIEEEDITNPDKYTLDIADPAQHFVKKHR